MIAYMSLEEQVDVEFGAVRRRMWLGRLMRLLRGGGYAGRLASFDEARRASGAMHGIHVGRRVVEVGKIVGSVGRYADFDPDFMPARRNLSERWKRVDRAFHRGEELPPVSLFKIGDAYFVNDGNHRVSVARYQGIEMIDADVVEFHALPFANQKPGSRPVVVGS
jgi:hypothetical protein